MGRRMQKFMRCSSSFACVVQRGFVVVAPSSSLAKGTELTSQTKLPGRALILSHPRIFNALGLSRRWGNV